MQGEFGPFQPNRECQVPLWMALALWKRKKCTIKAPEWMRPEFLQSMLLVMFLFCFACTQRSFIHDVMIAAVLELERSEPGNFQPLPFHYQEIAQFLFTAGTQESLPKEVFGDEEARVRDLVNLIQKTRQTKILQGLSLLQEAAAVKLNNLSAMELNNVRAFFTGALDEFTRHATMNDQAIVQAVGTTQEPPLTPQEEARPARQLRRTTNNN